MEISTSLNVYYGKGKSYEDIIHRAFHCGFQCFDFNPTDYYNADTPSFITEDNWRDRVKQIKEYADSLGVRFGQSHAYITNKIGPDFEYKTKKSIEASAIAGVPWVVMHTWPEDNRNREEFMQYNLEMFRPYIDYAEKMGVGIAIENVPHTLYWYSEKIVHTYFNGSDDLIELVDQLNHEFGNVGICWDTGHANLSMKSQKNDLKNIGERLKVTHIADNYNQQDDHLPPFYGSTDFREIVHTLHEIGYKGTFNFETHRFTQGLPDELTDDAVRLLYKIGQYLCNPTAL